MRQTVYIAGPISKGDLQHNIDVARDAGRKLLEAGFSVLVPQLTCFFSSNNPSICGGGIAHEVWMESDLAWVLVSDCVLRLPGESMGADKEVAFAEAHRIPVYHDIDKLIDDPPPRGDARFHAALRKIGRLHDQKQRDYGTGQDPFANIRASQEFGIPPWLGAIVRLNDKVNRLKSFAINGNLVNEGALDSMEDIAVYALIASVLFKESNLADGYDPH